MTLFRSAPEAIQLQRTIILTAGLVAALMIAGALAPVATATEDHDYHFYGDVFLAGAAKSGTTLTVTDADGGSVVTVAYGESADTSVGKAQVKDQEGPDGVYEDRVHYYFEVPAGSYTLTFTNGDLGATVTVDTTSTESYELEWGTYYIQQVEDVTLAAASTDEDASTGDETPEASTDDGNATAPGDANETTDNTTPVNESAGNATVNEGANASTTTNESTGNTSTDSSTDDSTGSEDAGSDSSGGDAGTDGATGDGEDATGDAGTNTEDAHASDDVEDDAHDAGTQDADDASTKTPGAGALLALAGVGAAAVALRRRG